MKIIIRLLAVVIAIMPVTLIWFLIIENHNYDVANIMLASAFSLCSILFGYAVYDITKWNDQSL